MFFLIPFSRGSGYMKSPDTSLCLVWLERQLSGTLSGTDHMRAMDSWFCLMLQRSVDTMLSTAHLLDSELGPVSSRQAGFCPAPAYFSLPPRSATWRHDRVLSLFITNTRFTEGAFQTCVQWENKIIVFSLKRVSSFPSINFFYFCKGQLKWQSKHTNSPGAYYLSVFS